MLRHIASKVTWMARATTTVVGLAIMLALVVGVATTALGANGQAWILGQNNAATAITKLAGAAGVNGPMLQLINNNADANDTALDLRVQAGEAPMRVNSSTRVANLNAATAGRAGSAASADNATNAQNADKLDSLDSADLQRANAAAGGDLTGNYPNPQIAPNAVSGGLNGEIANDTVDQNDIATGGVGSAEVEDGSLRVRDIAVITANKTISPVGDIGAESCTLFSGDLTGVKAGDLPISIAPPDIPRGLVVSAERVEEDNELKWHVCNVTAAAIDPPLLQATIVVLRP